MWSSTSLMSPRLSVGPYTPDSWVMLWPINGSCSITCAGRTVTLREGGAHLSPPGLRHDLLADPENAVRVGSIHFRMPQPGEWPRHRTFPPFHFVPALLNHVLWLSAERPDGWEDERDEAFRCVLRAFVRGYMADDPLEDAPLAEPFARVIAHVQVGWGRLPLEAHTLDELAAAAGVTKSHLCRLFERETGMGPVGAFRVLRLERAAALLRQTNRSVISIAQQVGYASEFHFSRAFKSFCGTSPLSFRSDPEARFDLPPGLQMLSSRLWRQIRDEVPNAM